MNVRNLISPLLLRLAALGSTFAFALITTFAWQNLQVSSSSHDSFAEVVGVLTPANVNTPMLPEREKESCAGHYWIFRGDKTAPEFDPDQPVAIPDPDADSVVFGCVTLRVLVDEEGRLSLNGEDAGSLDDPAVLNVKLERFFNEREVNRAFRFGMEHRAELPSHERIDKTIVIESPAASISYGEALKLARILERAGAGPILLHVGEPQRFCGAAFTT